MAQMQPIPEPLGRPEISLEDAYYALLTYQLEVKATEEALDSINYQDAFSHLLVATNSASYLLGLGSVWRGFWGFTKGAIELTTDITRDIPWHGMGGGGKPPERNHIILRIEEWLESSWAAKLTEMAGRVAGGLGAESYQIQAGYPVGVSIALIFPAGKRRPSAKEQDTRKGASSEKRRQAK